MNIFEALKVKAAKSPVQETDCETEADWLLQVIEVERGRVLVDKSLAHLRIEGRVTTTEELVDS